MTSSLTHTGSMFFDSGADGAEKCDEPRGEPACATTRSDVTFGVVSSVERLEVDDPDRTILSAAIVAPLFVPRVVHAVRDAAAVGRDLALIRARERHRRLDTAFDRHGPEARRARSAPSVARDELKTIDFPSGVHPWTTSAPGCQVRRFGSPPSAGTT